MAIAVNRNTTQAPMTAAGRTGSQTIKFIPAGRVYIKSADSTTTTPVQSYFTSSNGSTPAGWTDLGSINGMVKITYDKKVQEVKTGMDEYLRAAYVGSKEAKAEFDLAQFDDVILEQLTGYTGSVIQSGSIVNYQVGEEDLVQKALLIVAQNKLDSKEFQFYNPAAYLNFVFSESNDGMVLKATAILPAFTPQGESKESFFSTTIFRI